MPVPLDTSRGSVCVYLLDQLCQTNRSRPRARTRSYCFAVVRAPCGPVLAPRHKAPDHHRKCARVMEGLPIHNGVQTGGWCSVFPGSICVSGFATPVVNCGTAWVCQCKIHTRTYTMVVLLYRYSLRHSCPWVSHSALALHTHQDPSMSLHDAALLSVLLPMPSLNR